MKILRRKTYEKILSDNADFRRENIELKEQIKKYNSYGTSSRELNEGSSFCYSCENHYKYGDGLYRGIGCLLNVKCDSFKRKNAMLDSIK